MDKKTVKMWAVINKRGAIEYVAPDGWNFHWGIFKRKYAAVQEAEHTDSSYRVVPCTITYELPTK